MRVMFVLIALGFGAVAAGGCASRQAGPVHSTVQLADLNGRTHQPLAASSAIATVIIFITTDCPIANGYAPEINSIVREYSGTGVRFFLAHEDPSVRLDQALRHAKEYGLHAPVLMDDGQQLARAVGATVTPEAAVIDRMGQPGVPRQD